MTDDRCKLHPWSALWSILLFLAAIVLAGATACARDASGTPGLQAGAGSVLDPRTKSSANTDPAVVAALEKIKAAPTTKAAPVSSLVMADVSQVMNVRALPDVSSDKIGVLYKDCGGSILEQKDGWTKIRSGDLIGWASNDYLLFGEEAEALAQDVGVTMAVVTTDGLRVRAEPNQSSSPVYDLVKTGDAFEVVGSPDDSDFVHIDYKGKDAYLSADYVVTELRVDHGETLEAIAAREKAERAMKAKANATAMRGAVQTSDDEMRLLAALIQCESGNQPYDGQLGVGAVVMNRVRSGAYPNTIVGVIFASGQFSPAGSGRVNQVYNSGNIKASCLQAAQAAIGGHTSVGGALHFRRVGNHEGIVIGAHVFW